MKYAESREGKGVCGVTTFPENMEFFLRFLEEELQRHEIPIEFTEVWEDGALHTIWFTISPLSAVRPPVETVGLSSAKVGG